MKLYEMFNRIIDTVSEISEHEEEDYLMFFVDLDKVEEFSEVLYHDVDFLYPATLQGTCLVVEVHKYDISANLDYCYSLRDELITMLDDYYKIY